MADPVTDPTTGDVTVPFTGMMPSAGSPPAAPAPTTAEPTAPPAPTPTAPTTGEKTWGGTLSDLGESALGGAAQAGLEVKDFFLGEVPREQRSPLRAQIEDRNAQLKKESAANAFVSGVSQFAVGLIGLGKITKPIAAIQTLAKSGKAGRAAVEIGKGATVGAIAIDPHEERLSNVIEQFPMLQNPMTEFLKAKPGDSAAEGRLKNAMEGIGLDLAVIGVIAGGAKVLRGLKSGDTAAVEAGAKELEVGSAGLAAREAGDSAPVPAASVPEPPVAEGFTRMYHGAADHTPDGGGRWFSSDRKYAQQYGKDNSTSYVDLPDDHPLLAPFNVDEFTNVKNGNTASIELPGVLADQRVVLGAAQDATGETVTLVPNQTQALAADGLTPATAPKAPVLVEVGDVDPQKLLTAARDDALAVDLFGSREWALVQGHKFSSEKMPWQKIVAGGNPDDASAAEMLIGRLADSRKLELDAIKGGDVLADASVDRSVRAMARAWNEDPASVMGLIARGGDAGRDMVANMETGFYVASRAAQDVWTMAARIDAGDLTAWGGNKAAAETALKDMMAVSATALANSKSMLSNAGRALRRSRGDFAIDEATLARFQNLDGPMMAKLLTATGGDPALVAKVLKPKMLEQIRDGAQFLYVNNLLWGLRTHFVNFSTNMYMVGGRPLERIIGSYALDAPVGARVRAENYKQFAYMGASLSDAWRAAVQTYKAGDSVLNPHGTEALNMGGNTGKVVAQMPWKPMDSVGGILHNALAFGAKSIGQPTRLLGTVDELVKQTVYRSKVQSQAHIDGIEQGLKGADLTAYVKSRLDGAFDEAGAALDTKALQEAMVTTFQQELLPNTMGKSISVFTNNHPAMKFILPFIRTPTNVLRMGVKMTPGLNMLQTEYRAMIRGEMGPELQAQAVGQMSMGALFLSTAATLAYSGVITGGGPSDRAAKDLLMSTGWQPYSFVRTGPKGEKTYIPYGRYDPVALPFGIVADLVDALSLSDDDATAGERIGDAALGIMVGVSKQMAQKTYLMSLNQAMDALMDPDRNMAKTAGQTASNMIPFASGLRFMNQDPYLRDARDFSDRILNTIPGLSQTIPAKRDIWGDPRAVHKGIWVSTPDDAVDAEVRRMVEDEGMVLGPVPPTRDGVDLRDIKMVNGKNAYEQLQILSGKPSKGAKPLKQVVAKIISGKAYEKAPDGDSGVKGTKQYILTGVISDYREAAFRQLRADKNVREQLLKERMRVRDAYTSKRGQDTGTTRPSTQPGLEEIGKALGVDLNSMGR